MFLKTQYLLGAYISELTGEMFRSERARTRPHKEGPKGGRENAWEELFLYEDKEIPVFCFKLNTLRPRKGELTRTIALPKGYDPWAEEIFNYFNEKPKTDYVFPYKRQDVMVAINKSRIFAKLRYNERPLGNGHLRYIRQKELERVYDFDDPDLDAYGLVKMHVTRKAVGDLTPKTSNRWEKYIMKLTKKTLIDEKVNIKQRNDKEISSSNWAWGKGYYVLHFVCDWQKNLSLCNRKMEFDRLQPNQLEPDDFLKCKTCLKGVNRNSLKDRTLEDFKET